MSTLATTLSQAQSAKGELRAGGTDLTDRHHLQVSHGEIVDISRIPGLDQIQMNADGTCAIGALVTIHQVATSEVIRQHYPGLAETAGALANPQIRRAASMGGALLQRNRCWYYRHEGFSCFKKGGDSCPMREGNHVYGVCFDLGPCVSAHPSTLGMALMAYNAEVEVDGKGRRSIMALYGDGKDPQHDHLLGEGEILTQIHLPKGLPGELHYYHRTISRARAEWPLVEVLVIGNNEEGLRITNPRVVIGGVANVPMRLTKVEAYLDGTNARRARYQNAGQIAIQDANPLPGTQYKLEMVAMAVELTVEAAFASLEHDD